MEVHQQYPDDFKCPISLEVMSDPVILTSGHTFDRSSIERWLESGNRTCPVTKLLLPLHPPLIPNHALRSLISSFSSSTTAFSTPSTDPHHQSLLSALSFPAKPQILAEIRQISKKDRAFRRLISDSGAVAVLLRHVGCGERPQLQEASLRVVLDVSLDDDDAKVGLVADGAVDHVVAALREGASPGCRALAATTLTSLAMADVNKCTIGAHPSAIPELVGLLSGGKGKERREAATALFALCSFPENRKRTVKLGAVPVLVELAASWLERAVEVLGLLGKCREGKAEMRKVDGCVAVMAGVLRKGNRRGVENALLVLNLVCADSGEMRCQARKEGVSEISMSLVGEESGKIRKLAAELANTLQTRDFESLI